MVRIVLYIYELAEKKLDNKFNSTVLQKEVSKTKLFTKTLTTVKATQGEIKFAWATFQLVESPDFKIKLEK